MLISLNDFTRDHVDFNINEDEIYIYYNDFLNIEKLKDIISLTFFTDNKIQLKKLPFKTRLTVGEYYMQYYNFIVVKDNNLLLRNKDFIDSLPNAFSETYKNFLTEKNSIENPNEVPELHWNGFSDDTKYFILLLFFKHINYFEKTVDYSRTIEIFTDTILNENSYNIITDIKTFFIISFGNYLKTSYGQIPFLCDFGNNLNDLVQSKNLVYNKVIIENEIENYFVFFSSIYNEFIQVDSIDLQSIENASGGDNLKISIQINVLNATIRFLVNI